MGPTHGRKAANATRSHLTGLGKFRDHKQEELQDYNTVRTLGALSCDSSIMLRRLNTSFFWIAVIRRTIPTRPDDSVCLFSNLALRKPYPLLSETPCKLAYIKPCKYYQLRPDVHLHPQDPHGEKVKESLDAIMPNRIPLEDDSHDIGEVAISPDRLLHPETA